MNKDEIWRDKIRAVTQVMGTAGEAIFREIEEAVDARIEEARDDGWSTGYGQGQMQTYGD